MLPPSSLPSQGPCQPDLCGHAGHLLLRCQGAQRSYGHGKAWRMLLCAQLLLLLYMAHTGVLGTCEKGVLWRLCMCMPSMWPALLSMRPALQLYNPRSSLPPSLPPGAEIFDQYLHFGGGLLLLQPHLWLGGLGQVRGPWAGLQNGLSMEGQRQQHSAQWQGQEHVVQWHRRSSNATDGRAVLRWAGSMPYSRPGVTD